METCHVKDAFKGAVVFLGSSILTIIASVFLKRSPYIIIIPRKPAVAALYAPKPQPVWGLVAKSAAMEVASFRLVASFAHTVWCLCKLVVCWRIQAP